MYVETSSRLVTKNAVSAFEVAALASMGKLRLKSGQLTPRSTPSPRGTSKKQRFSSISPGDSLDRTDELRHLENTDLFWDQFNQYQTQKHMTRSQSECPKTPSLGSSRSASLSSKTRSSTSIPSITSSGLSGSKTPKPSRRSSKGPAQAPEKMITIKCQRLTADKTYEEIEVEVPAPIYETIQLYNDTTTSLTPRTKERRSFGHKLKNLFVKSTS